MLQPASRSGHRRRDIAFDDADRCLDIVREELPNWQRLKGAFRVRTTLRTATGHDRDMFDGRRSTVDAVVAQGDRVVLETI